MSVWMGSNLGSGSALVTPTGATTARTAADIAGDFPSILDFSPSARDFTSMTQAALADAATRIVGGVNIGGVYTVPQAPSKTAVWEVEETIDAGIVPFCLIAQDRSFCQIQRFGDFGPSFKFGGSATLANNFGLMGFWLTDPTNLMTVGNSPFHIVVDHAAKGRFDFRVSEGAGIMRLAGCYKTYIRCLAGFSLGASTGRIGFLIEKSAVVGATNPLGGDIHFQETDVEGGTVAASPRLDYIWKILAGDGIYIEAGCHAQHSALANVLLKKSGADQLTNIRISRDVLLDICQGHGIDIDGTDGTDSIDTLTVDCEINCASAGAASKHGVFIHANAGLTNARFDITANGWKGDGFRCESQYVSDVELRIKSKACDEYGAYIFEGDRWKVYPQIGGTGSENIGLRIGTSVTDIMVTAGNISECVIGVQVDDGADEWSIVGVDLRDNATPLNDLSTTTKKHLADCPGVSPPPALNMAEFADLTGVIAADAGTVKAIAILAARGGGTLFHPAGTYKRNAIALIEADNVRLEFAPGAVIDCSGLAYDSGVRASGCAFKFQRPSALAATTTLASDAASGATSIVVTSATGMAVGQLVRMQSDKVLQNQSGEPVYFTNVNRIIGISGTTISLQFALSLAFTVSGQTVTITTYNLLVGCSVTGGDFRGGGTTENLANGMGRVGIAAYYTDGFSVEHAKFDKFQGFAVYTDTTTDTSVYGLRMDGIAVGETIVEAQNSGYYGFVANRARGVLAESCRGNRVRHLFDGLDAHNYQQVDSRVYSTHRAAFGSHGSVHSLMVANCMARRCYAGGTVRAHSSKWSDCDFEADLLDGFSTFVGVSGDTPGQLEMHNMRIKAPTAARYAVVLSGAFDFLVITNPTFISAGTAFMFNGYYLENFVFSGGVLQVLTAGSAFEISHANSLAHFKRAVVRGVTAIGYTVTGFVVRGALDITNPAEGIFVEQNVGLPPIEGAGNLVQVRTDGWYGDNLSVSYNSIFGDLTEMISILTTNGGRFRSAPRVEGNHNYVDADGVGDFRAQYVVGSAVDSAALTGHATILPGAIVQNRKPAGTDVLGYICTSMGTEGSISGVTGDITSGTPTLVLTGNDGIKVTPGMRIQIAGAGVASANLGARVIAMTADFVTATIDVNASTTVDDAAVTRINPTMVALPQLAST